MTPEERSRIYGRTGKKHLEETKKKLRDIFKGRIVSEETRKKLRIASTGHKLSEESRQKISNTHKEKFKRMSEEEKSIRYKRVCSEETKKKLSEANKNNIPPNIIKIMIDGVEYKSITEAGKQLGINKSVVWYRIKSKNPMFDNYKYAENNVSDIDKISKKTKSSYVRKDRPKKNPEDKILSTAVKVIIDDTLYNSMTEAGIKLSLHRSTIAKRINSTDPQFSNYKYAENRKKIISSNGIKIIIDDILYNSINEASTKLSLDKHTITKRIKSNDLKFDNYKYA